MDYLSISEAIDLLEKNGVSWIQFLSVNSNNVVGKISKNKMVNIKLLNKYLHK